MRLLAVNTGSSSVRLADYRAEGARLELRWRKRYDAQDPSVFASCEGEPAPQRIAHRIVHGGSRLTRPCVVDAAVEAEIERLVPLAPLHNPVALAFIRAARSRWPGAVHVAVFDTGFFADLPAAAATYALPTPICRELGIRRYGFHGLAHRSMWQTWQRQRARTGGRLISFQLGAGCSATAISDGQPVDTSMGMTPLEGLVMATRCGDVDPGVLSYLQRRGGRSPAALDHLLEAESGLLGLSRESSDLRLLLRSQSSEARRAIDVYVHRARKYLGAYLVILGGADAIAFGGGVGEHLPEIRERILEGLSWCGLHLDPQANAGARGALQRISRADSAVEVWVTPVDEETALAEEALSVERP